MLFLSLALACFPPYEPFEDSESSGQLSTSEIIDANGGIVSLGDVTLEIPEGALDSEVQITISETDQIPGEPYVPYSSVWLFEPDGLVFSTPVQVSIAYDDRGEGDPLLFWSNFDGDYDELAAIDNGLALTAWVDHFSTGFAGTYQQQTFHHAFEPAALDVLFVVDNSGSMEEEQYKMSTASGNLLSFVNDHLMDWHVGVVTTDMAKPTMQGRLQDINGQLYLDETSSNASTHLATALQPGTLGSSNEKGLAAAYSAIELLSSGDNAGFYRSEAQLAVFVISDEDDQSGENPFGLTDFINWFSGLKPDLSEVSFHSVVGTGSCYDAIETGARYINVTDAVGGGKLSICAADYSPIVEGASASWYTSAPLELAQVPDENTLVVTVHDGSSSTVLAEKYYTFQASRNALRLVGFVPEQGATIEINYEVASNQEDTGL
ncbi:MAG: hypothetical protein HN348_08930 [Proteobacteria bacterium]|jgi:hypothetical protein|nr:hypothetical protein [Pseudomonadota bacterium]